METIDNGMYKEIYTLEVKSEQLIAATELIQGIYTKKVGCVFYFSGNKKHMQAANILVVKGIKILTVNDKEVKSSDGNQKSEMVQQGRTDGIRVTCAPAIKASNHAADKYKGLLHSRFRLDYFGFHYNEEYFLYATFGEKILQSAELVNFTHLWLPRDTNENTNRA